MSCPQKKLNWWPVTSTTINTARRSDLRRAVFCAQADESEFVFSPVYSVACERISTSRTPDVSVPFHSETC